MEELGVFLSHAVIYPFMDATKLDFLLLYHIFGGLHDFGG